MIALKITNLKKFTTQLFLQEVFDSFLFLEGQITTFNTFNINGLLNKEFYNDIELEDIGTRTYSTWKQMRPLCFQLIKGNKLPLSFKFVLKMKNESDANSLLLNIIYKNGMITCTTGVFLKQFSLDKTIDKEWDVFVRRFLQQYNIEFIE